MDTLCELLAQQEYDVELSKGLAKLGDMPRGALMSPSMSPSLSTSETVAHDKICSRDRKIFLGDNRNISCNRDMQMTGRACFWLVTRMFSHPGRHARYSVARNKSPSLAIA